MRQQKLPHFSWCERRDLLRCCRSYTPTSAKTVHRTVFFRFAPSFSSPVPKNKKEPLMRLFLIWCERRDLNPYGITTRPSNVRVCRFRHSRIQLLFLKERMILYPNIGEKSIVFCKKFIYILLCSFMVKLRLLNVALLMFLLLFLRFMV